MNNKIIQLSEPTVFPDLNKSEHQDINFERSELKLNSLKYKHFREVMKKSAEDQMHHLMKALTGLSENDLGELSPTDAAEISAIIFDSMKNYMELGKKITKGIQE